jgi:hypothetical protein
MMQPQTPLTLGVNDAAAKIGVSKDTFESRVLPYLDVIRLPGGRKRLVYVSQLEEWIKSRALTAGG